MQDTDLPEKIEPTSLNLQTELATQLAELVPEAMSDGKLDVTKLRELVNGDAENSPEKFGLFWPGKRAAQALAQIPTTATLVPAPDESVDWDTTKNIFIEGDNLEVLKALQNSYRRKVKMIYIDPPYNTGKEFIYPDKFSEGLQGYLEYTGQKNEAGENVESKPETGGRKHSNWLSMMYPRLQLAKSLLADEGVIFISIGDDEYSNLKEICDEVFQGNYIDTFIVRSNPRGNQAKKYTASQHEYILAYGKKIEFIEPLGHSKTDDEYNKSDANGIYREIGLRKRGAGSRRIDAPNQYYPIFFDEVSGNLSTTVRTEGCIEIYPMLSDGTEGRWRWAHTTVESNKEKLIARKVRKRDGTEGYDVFEKDYFTDEKTTKIKSLLVDPKYNYESATDDIRRLFGGKKVFPYTKPKELIEHLIEAARVTEDSIVMDFFAGSGTTMHSALLYAAKNKFNLRTILVQLPEVIDPRDRENQDALDYCNDKNLEPLIPEISKQRIKLAAKEVEEETSQDDFSLDAGFRVYKLAPSNFVQWDENKAKDDIQQSVLDFAANKKPDAAPESLLTEIMLQARMPLSANIEKRDLQNGGWVYVVDSGNLIAYVADEQITEVQANEIADLAPAKLIVLDSAFNGNNALKINVMNICKEKFIKEFKTI